MIDLNPSSLSLAESKRLNVLEKRYRNTARERFNARTAYFRADRKSVV